MHDASLDQPPTAPALRSQKGAGSNQREAEPLPIETYLAQQRGDTTSGEGRSFVPGQRPERTLGTYQERHQIELFMREMMTGLFTTMPEDPFAYMTAYLAAHKPAAPPAQAASVCSAALWVLLPGGDALFAQHWRLRRCWMTESGVFCISNATSRVERSQNGGVLIAKPSEVKPREVKLEIGCRIEVLADEVAAMPFAFRLLLAPFEQRAPADVSDAERTLASCLTFAAASYDQREEWIAFLEYFILAARPTPATPSAAASVPVCASARADSYTSSSS
mmetsp:Transcript_47292/g.132068  ORF Transcript_47292/g.132068 Transcript_47292/m.132068 type:complete len:278 (-) Transcript_47292:92-925(-)